MGPSPASRPRRGLWKVRERHGFSGAAKSFFPLPERLLARNSPFRRPNTCHSDQQDDSLRESSCGAEESVFEFLQRKRSRTGLPREVGRPTLNEVEGCQQVLLIFSFRGDFSRRGICFSTAVCFSRAVTQPKTQGVSAPEGKCLPHASCP